MHAAIGRGKFNVVVAKRLMTQLSGKKCTMDGSMEISQQVLM